MGRWRTDFGEPGSRPAKAPWPSRPRPSGSAKRSTRIGWIPRRYLMAAEYGARSIMAAPLVVSNESMGAAVFLHCSDPDFFNRDLAAKATILAGQLGSLLEASRLTQVSQEEHRRTKILAEVAQAIRSAPESTAVVEAVADRLRILLRTRLVCIMLREGGRASVCER